MAQQGIDNATSTGKMIFQINVELVDARNHGIGGTRHRVKSENDIEPVIQIPIKEMRSIDRCLAA